MPDDPRTKHVVVLMMENRSFDHMLGFLRRENADIRGVVGGDYSNVTGAGVTVSVTDGASYQGQLLDPGHEFDDVYQQLYGVPAGTPAGPQPDMSGFAQSYELKGGVPADIMRGFLPTDLPVLTTLARQYVVCDQWFSSVPGPTLPNRAFVHFGTSFGRLDMSPDYFRAKASIYQRMKLAGKTGRIYYYAPWSGTLGLTFLLSDQRKYFGLWGDFVSDCKKDKLPEYSFIEPAYSDNGGTLACDQHPDHNVRAGDNFIRQVYDAIRSNDQVWESTVLLIVWDEHGGLFDHEIPPVVQPDGFVSTVPPFSFDRLGVRVPAVVVSPYVEPGGVDHTVYEHASIPATVTERFIGPPLTTSPYAREQHANTFLHLLSRNTPRADRPDFTAAAAPAPPIAAVASGAAPASTLHLSLVQDTHAVIARQHPEAARALLVSKVKTERDAARFVARAMAIIHPKPAGAATPRMTSRPVPTPLRKTRKPARDRARGHRGKGPR